MLESQKMPKQDAKTRITNFDEVALGFTKEQAIREANRCLQCSKPKCIQGCPVEIRIPDFIKYIAQGDFDSAIDIIKKDNSLPAICGRVCPQETQCEEYCILSKKSVAVSIGHLERFVADYERSKGIKVSPPSRFTGKKIAVVGSGTCRSNCCLRISKDGTLCYHI